MEEKKYDWLIVGAGLFGSVFAHEMTRAGLRCLVIDKRAKVGGNCSCSEWDGMHVHDYGAHIVHTSSREIWDYIDSLMPLRRYHHQVMAKYKDELFTLPFCMHTFRELYGADTPYKAKDAIRDDCEEIAEIKSVRDLALATAGRKIFDTLVEGYTEKQWGRCCSELPAFILGRIPLRFTFDTSYYNEEYVGLPADGNYNTLFARLLEGCDVKLNTEYKRSMDGLADRVLYTGGIDAFYDFRLGRLGYRSLHFGWMRDNVSQGCAVINHTGGETPFTRSIEHNFFNPPGKDAGAFFHSYEYPEEYDGRNEPIYPINTDENNALFSEYRKLAEREEKVIFGGRLGSYSYYAMDNCIKAAIELAKREKPARTRDNSEDDKFIIRVKKSRLI